MQQARAAAVLLTIGAEPPHHIAFVERAAHLRRHPGQVALPGGLADADDGDDRIRTALRELHEELGIPAERVTVVGQLPDVAGGAADVRVTPIVGVLAAGTTLRIDPTETAAVFTVPLDALIAPGAVRRGVERFETREIPSWLFDYGSLHVWGLTARMLRDFVVAWHAPQSPLQAAVRALLTDR